MNGFIGVTSREWFTYLSGTNVQGEINFWRKNTNNFKVLVKGEPFFFIVKNEKGVRGERAVLGKATYERFEVLEVEEAWNKYGVANGDKDKESFLTRMEDMFGRGENKDEIGCIILSDFQVFDNPVYLSNTDIEFANSIVSGKGIEEIEINEILKQAFSTMDDVLNKLNEIDRIGLTEDDMGFPEGKLKLRQHLVRERNSKVVRLAKKYYLKEHGKLVCEVCGFDFIRTYGSIGEGYIEGHHTRPVSEMNENERTQIEDIALVCSNCHRMLHRRRPWLLIDKLKELLI